MEKLDKVIAGLEFCGEANKSVDACLAMCPYYGERDGDKVCMDFLLEDALDGIERLREENRDLRKDIEVLTEDLTGAHEEIHALLKKRDEALFTITDTSYRLTDCSRKYEIVKAERDEARREVLRLEAELFRLTGNAVWRNRNERF